MICIMFVAQGNFIRANIRIYEGKMLEKSNCSLLICQAKLYRNSKMVSTLIEIQYCCQVFCEQKFDRF